MDSKIGSELNLIVVEAIRAIRGRCASFMIQTATVSDILWTDKLIYFSSIDITAYRFSLSTLIFLLFCSSQWPIFAPHLLARIGKAFTRTTCNIRYLLLMRNELLHRLRPNHHTKDAVDSRHVVSPQNRPCTPAFNLNEWQL